MLGTITAADFQPLQGKECTFEATSALSVKLTVEQITSRPDCQVPGADEAREPFGVLLSGQQDEVDFTSATGVLRLGDGATLEGVYINRVLPPMGGDPRPWYQLVFN
ncbi:hypothetical protein E0L35_19560 [Halomonas sp. ATBC28]|uniref:DUF6916 family protein n=1 Tax=Halomonadaceae TaxID=28256 RepID=UPI00048412FB|nr:MULTISPECIES: hypothetical protein [Halomonas]NAO96752.1 hypothetical protein [Halomonas sp. MG34]QGQ69968.1 hypothetical protein FDY98_07630 [Halomonas sp. PA16-9]KIN16324.1 hypothetical protein RO22_06930 [Halomonas sp. KHS3]PKH63297.1 hypothetical protein CXF94_00430 [Halomonas sp. Choline-3u-9]TMU17976.1 hypothetical protein E0L35_19560 [Halomonas sp. ATBC28]